MNREDFIPIIGLEVHVELKTKSKMFCGCAADYFGHEPNTHCCPVCLGLPGALPVPNRRAVEWCIMLGLALDCQIPKTSKFDRKNYFYPDLPKGYQISQYDMPLAINGSLELKTPFGPSSGRGQNSKLKTIRIRRVHMEEDTGKLVHTKEATLIDFNRSGVPLMEIVTEPDIHSGQEAKIFLQKLQQIIRYLGISDADMEKGSMRLEPNISIKVKSDDELPSYKVEVKNINSFRFVEKAIDYEIKRQTDLLQKGERIRQETRGWSEKQGVTLPQRSKEEAMDYRYFPEPDIPPMRWTDDEIRAVRSKIPELPDAKLARFIKDYGLGEYDANILTTSLLVANYFEECIKYIAKRSPGRSPSGHLPGGAKRLLEGEKVTPKTIANWIINKQSFSSNKKLDINKTLPQQLVQMISQQGQAFTISNEELEKIIKKVLEANSKAVSDYNSGKQQAIMFLIGQVLKETKGQVDPGKVEKMLATSLNGGDL